MWSELERRAARAAEARDAGVSDAARQAHGVVHTPPELCRYVALRCQQVLQERGLDLGDSRVTLVDPACGPGGFLAACLTVSQGLPGRIVGLDRDADSLRVAADVLSSALEGTDRRLELIAGDTLSTLESVEKSDMVVVVGNPPWAGKTATRTELSEVLLEDFRRDALGERLKERKLGVLSDAYVRFFRWAAEAVRQAPGGGIVALVTNASFLDGPVHRGMRAALGRWFDRIDVVDLGGSALVAQAKGSRDENVFGVRPAVAITVAQRFPDHDEDVSARVRVSRIRGSRKTKLDALQREVVFHPVETDRPWRVVPQQAAKRYPEHWVGLDHLFPFHREGVQTNRDAIVVDADRERLLARLQSFVLGLRRPDLDAAWVPKSHYDPERARKAVQVALQNDTAVRRIAYRPWDERWFAPVTPLCHRPRPALAAAMAQSTLALLTVRKDRGERGWSHFGVSRVIPDNCFLSARSSCRTRAFPTHDADGRPNISSIAEQWLAGVQGEPEDLFHYVLAVLAAASFQERFGWLLAQDYPVIPPPSPETRTDWHSIVAAGRALSTVFVEGVPGKAPHRVGHWERPTPLAYPNVVAACEQAVAPLLRR